MQRCRITFKYWTMSDPYFLNNHPVISNHHVFFNRIPTAGVGPDWPDNIYFTFQFYRFPPVTSQQLKLLTSDKVQRKARDPLPCVLACINKDGTVNSGKDPPLQNIMLFISLLKWRVMPAIGPCASPQWILRWMERPSLKAFFGTLVPTV